MITCLNGALWVALAMGLTLLFGLPGARRRITLGGRWKRLSQRRNPAPVLRPDSPRAHRRDRVEAMHQLGLKMQAGGLGQAAGMARVHR